MQRWLERIPGLGSGPLWRRWLSAGAYVVAAAVIYQAYAAAPNPEPGPVPTGTPQPAVSSRAPQPGPPDVTAQPAPPQPVTPPPGPSIYGKWHGETPMASPIGTVTAIIEIVFVQNGNYSALSTSTYPGGTPMYVTGHFTVDAAQRQIVVRDVRTDPRSSLEYILYRYTFLDANTMQLQDLGCLNYAPQQCGPITFVRVA